MPPDREYSRFACPNPNCSCYAKNSKGNIAHRSWTGKNKDIERLRCKQCRHEFSSREGTVLERSGLPVAKAVLLTKCLRWGMPDEAAADIAEVAPMTVMAFRHRLGQHAERHHDQCAQGVRSEAAQADELYVRQGPNKHHWIGASILISSMFIACIVVGERNQSMANRLMAELAVRCQWLVAFMTDGWPCYLKAFLCCFGRLYRPKRLNGKGPIRAFRLRVQKLYYAQVVKRRDSSYRLTGVEGRFIVGAKALFLQWIQVFDLGNSLHTAHIERFWATFRSCLPFARRRTRCFAKSLEACRDKAWAWVGLYNWVIAHRSLSTKTTLITPAMAAGLIDRPLSYRDYILTPSFRNPTHEQRLAAQLKKMNDPEVLKAIKRTRFKPEIHTIWAATPKPTENESIGNTG